MIKIEIEGLKYNIYFEYHVDENTGITTTCYIDPSIEDKKIVSTGLGVCTRYYKDIPNKNLGRKIALKRALDDAEWGKAKRTLVWDAYNEKVGLKKRKTGADPYPDGSAEKFVEFAKTISSQLNHPTNNLIAQVNMGMREKSDEVIPMMMVKVPNMRQLSMAIIFPEDMRQVIEDDIKKWGKMLDT